MGWVGVNDPRARASPSPGIGAAQPGFPALTGGEVLKENNMNAQPETGEDNDAECPVCTAS